jgi:hypothetical protein
MAGHLKQEVSVSALVKERSFGWPFYRQSAKDERPRGEAYILSCAFALRAKQFKNLNAPLLLF